jgi:hypothetical protein
VNHPIRWLLLTALLGAAWPTAWPEEADAAPLPATETADRELIVRFARAYGMALGSAPDGEDQDDLREPDTLDGDRRAEVEQILVDGGLSVDEWRGMFARMDDDPALRARIDSLSVPFQIQ